MYPLIITFSYDKKLSAKTVPEYINRFAFYTFFNLEFTFLSKTSNENSKYPWINDDIQCH